MPDAAGAPADTYDRLRRAIAGERLPVAVVDLDALDANIRALNAIASKRVRLATKSVRCPRVIKHIVDAGNICGLMTYSASETAFLADAGYDDLLLAYPTANAKDVSTLAALTARGKIVAAIVDDEAHLDALDKAAQAAATKVRVAIEVDMSFRAGGGRVHLGVRRSPLHTAADVAAFAAQVRSRAHLVLDGVMGYEAQIAGVTDKNPFSPLMNAPKRMLKLLSKPAVASTRADVARALQGRGFDIRFFNGGGTGSLRWSTVEDVLTEVTAGSGYLDSHLFSYYRDLDLTPAAYYAIQVVRRPGAGLVTCHGGGYVASGEAGVDRLPVPSLPAGLSLLGFEGAGEVQTPVVVPPALERMIKIGDPIFFRHAKAGELAEHFNEYLLVRGDRIVERAPTYRGLGHCFLG